MLLRLLTLLLLLLLLLTPLNHDDARTPAWPLYDRGQAAELAVAFRRPHKSDDHIELAHTSR